MAPIIYLTAIASTIFRVAGYLFLQVIPSGHLRKTLPTLYFAYLSGLYLSTEILSRSLLKTETANGEKGEEETTPTPEPQRSGLFDVLRDVTFSLPSPIRAATILNVTINTTILLLGVDLVLYPYLDDARDVVFTRVGAVYPDAAKLVVRYPTPNATESVVHILWRQVTSTADASWHTGPSVSLSAEHDWVNTTRLDGLWPSSLYEYTLGDNDYIPLPYPEKPIAFQTFPDPRLPTGSHFRFLATSCATPNFPYLPLNGRRIKGYDLLADYLWPKPRPNGSSQATPDDLALGEKVPAEFMIFLGDFIYADVPFYFGDNVETYRRLYRRNYQSPSFRKIYERLPMLHAYDDHEIINNFMGEGNDSIAPFVNADNAFRLYNAEANYDSTHANQHYYDFSYGDTAFFVMDTRRYRSDITKVEPSLRTMLGDKQLAAFHEWLSKVNNTAAFKFIVSSVPFTSLWQHDAQKDSWAGYPSEKASILKDLHSVKNVVILSGDRHEFATIRLNGEQGAHDVVEVSTSPMSMFYVPLVRTLRMSSELTVKRTHEVTSFVDGNNVTVVEEVEIPQEEVLRYIAEGNYKWSSFEVDTRNPQRPIVHLETVIEGKTAYRLEMIGQPVEIHPTTALAAAVHTGVRGILDRIGIKGWF